MTGALSSPHTFATFLPQLGYSPLSRPPLSLTTSDCFLWSDSCLPSLWVLSQTFQKPRLLPLSKCELLKTGLRSYLSFYLQILHNVRNICRYSEVNLDEWTKNKTIYSQQYKRRFDKSPCYPIQKSHPGSRRLLGLLYVMICWIHTSSWPKEQKLYHYCHCCNKDSSFYLLSQYYMPEICHGLCTKHLI